MPFDQQAVVDALSAPSMYGLPETAKIRSEEHTSELQSHVNLVCRLLLEKKKSTRQRPSAGPPTSLPSTLFHWCCVPAPAPSQTPTVRLPARLTARSEPLAPP